MRNLPFDLWRRNAVWLELVLAACDLTCWAQALLPDGALARAEPKALRYRLWHTAARVVRHARPPNPAPAAHLALVSSPGPRVRPVRALHLRC